MELYSKRNLKPQLTNDVLPKARARILAIFRKHMGIKYKHGLAKVKEQLIIEYGELDGAGFDDDPALDHFDYCDNERALDFVQCFLEINWLNFQPGVVDEINRALREEGAAYEFTQFKGALYVPHQVFPKPIKKINEVTHEEIIKPCFRLLASPKFTVANVEMMKAFDHWRHARFDDAITLCGSAFESVLKTICAAKKYPFDPDKDTCAKLVSICRDNKLFPPFYAPIFEATGTIRNKLSSGHGRAEGGYVVSEQHVAHAIQIAAAHIVLLVGLAKL